jgi:hypothetical protein
MDLVLKGRERGMCGAEEKEPMVERENAPPVSLLFRPTIRLTNHLNFYTCYLITKEFVLNFFYQNIAKK